MPSLSLIVGILIGFFPSFTLRPHHRNKIHVLDAQEREGQERWQGHWWTYYCSANHLKEGFFPRCFKHASQQNFIIDPMNYDSDRVPGALFSFSLGTQHTALTNASVVGGPRGPLGTWHGR